MTVKSLVFSVASVGLGLLIALFLAELIVRIAGVSSPMVYLPNALYGWSHTPNDRFSQKTEDYGLEIQTNSLGLRDFEIPYNRAPGIHRTLVLGDSFAEAFQVPLEASFPKLIEKQLNAGQPRDESSYEVVNAGTSGYGTDNELLFYRHEGYKYDSDVVLLAMYVGNDIRNNWYPLENLDAGGFRKPYFTLAGTSIALNEFPFAKHMSLASRIKVALNRNVRLYSLIRTTRDRLKDRNAADLQGKDTASIRLDTYLFREDYPQDWQTAWDVTKGLILQLRSEVLKHDATLFVVIIPTQFQVHEKYWQQKLDEISSMRDVQWNLKKPNVLLREFLSASEIAYLDLLPGFRRRAETSESEFYLVKDNHWNETGHQVASELIATELRTLILTSH